MDKSYLFKMAIGCLHGVEVPDNVFVDFRSIKKDKEGDYYVRMMGENFYLSSVIVAQIS